MEWGFYKDISNTVEDFIRGTSEELYVISGSVDITLCRTILKKAYEGVDVTVIFPEGPDFSWLKSQAERFRNDEEKQILRELKKREKKEKVLRGLLYSSLAFIPVMLLLGVAMMLEAMGLASYVLIGGGIAVLALYFYLRVLHRHALEEVSFVRERLGQFNEEVKGDREKISSRLRVHQSPHNLNGTIMINKESFLGGSFNLTLRDMKRVQLLMSGRRDELVSAIDQVMKLVGGIGENALT